MLFITGSSDVNKRRFQAFFIFCVSLRVQLKHPSFLVDENYSSAVHKNGGHYNCSVLDQIALQHFCIWCELPVIKLRLPFEQLTLNNLSRRLVFLHKIVKSVQCVLCYS